MLSLRGRDGRSGNYAHSVTFSTSSSDQEQFQRMRRPSNTSESSDTTVSPESQPGKFTQAMLSHGGNSQQPKVLQVPAVKSFSNQVNSKKEYLSNLFAVKTSAESARNLNKNDLFLRDFFLGFAKDFAIFKFKVGSKNINVSKLHFAERSEFYKQLIAKNSNESYQCVVDKLSLETVEQFANYIHFGKIEHLDKVAVEMLTLAKKYKIDELNDICSDYISSTTLSDKNVVQHLFRAFTGQDEKLKNEVLAYVTRTDGKSKNFKDIMDTVEWRILVDSDYPLASKIKDAVIEKLFD